MHDIYFWPQQLNSGRTGQNSGTPGQKWVTLARIWYFKPPLPEIKSKVNEGLYRKMSVVCLLCFMLGFCFYVCIVYFASDKVFIKEFYCCCCCCCCCSYYSYYYYSQWVTRLRFSRPSTNRRQLHTDMLFVPVTLDIWTWSRYPEDISAFQK